MLDYSVELFDTIVNFLKEDDWKFREDRDRGVIQAGVGLKSRLKEANILIAVYEEDYTVSVSIPLSADLNDHEQLARMSEFMTRINYSLRNGSFVMDFRDGEIGYKSFVDCADLSPSYKVIRKSIYLPVVMLDRCAEGILGILFTDMDAETAVSKCPD